MVRRPFVSVLPFCRKVFHSRRGWIRLVCPKCRRYSVVTVDTYPSLPSVLLYPQRVNTWKLSSLESHQSVLNARIAKRKAEGKGTLNRGPVDDRGISRRRAFGSSFGKTTSRIFAITRGGSQMRVGWTCPCVWLGMLMAYVVVSLLLLNPPLDPVGSGTYDIGPRIRSAESVDAIVFVALGPAARSNSLLYALSSLREKGRWDGPVYVIVDRADDLVCLNSHLAQPVSVIPTSAFQDGAEGEGAGPAVGAKMIKMGLLELLPPSIERVVYIDCDIITKRPIGPFLQEVGRLWREVDSKKGEGPGEALGAAPSHLKGGGGALPRAAGGEDQPSTLLIFPDAAGHTVPVCWACDRAHSGVVALARGHSERCLELWREAFLGGGKDGKGTATDQEAMDIALRQGSGCEAGWVDRRHMHFMKDPFVILGLTRKTIFAHFTSLLHPERLAGIHRRYYEWSLGRSFNEWGEIELKACAFDQ